MGCTMSKKKNLPVVTEWDLNQAGLTWADWNWMISHKGYEEKELAQMLIGFREDFPAGGIFRHQFEEFFPEIKMGKSMSDMVFSVLDGDHNGYLDFKEFQQAIDLVGARLPDDRLRWSFKLYDEDNSGSVQLAEMEKVMECVYNMFEGMGQRPSGDPKIRAKEIFEKIDINGDGELTENEFVRGCSEDKEMMTLLNSLFTSMVGN
ncbi:neuronal calcium sensor 2 isoform X1 [Eurytemora carolleeae]|uniref:neuronal calcium sensor 2 isoform X1 n=2 Tax=Eurytemora carolleeae TaxID=1294199 RepID=UPI000C781960|nr:neuronal calcium sensor 2 isoform X1 [Eurytemora carolleeae]|eukprot:XP_023331293.1 neuronal calcium sensor 2-like isoform X1 [Eurytemora affinis]